MPKISFVIPTKNREKMLKEALDSLIPQTETDWEAIVVDDHGDDNSADEVAKFGDSRLRYYKLPDKRGRGAASARNYGNMLAKSDLIAVLDSDDLALPERVAVTLASYKEHGWDLFSGGRKYIDLDTGETREPAYDPLEWDPERYMKLPYTNHSTFAYTKKAAMEIPYNSAFPNNIDGDLMSRFMVLGKKIHYIPEPLIVLRRHSGSMMRSEYRPEFVEFMRQIRGWSDEKMNPEELA